MDLPPLFLSPLAAELGLLLGLSLVGSRPVPDVTHRAWAPRRLQDTGEVPPPGDIAELPLCRLPRPQMG